MRTVAICGDWHGDTAYAEAALEVIADAGIKQVVHVGDFGFWPRTPLDEGPGYLMRLQDVLKAAGIQLWWVDGNHEDFDVLGKMPLDDTGKRPVAHNIYHLPRGYRWQWDGNVWMALGGAASVDKSVSTPWWDWFPQELITLEDVEYATRAGNVDVMVTHDAPFSTPTLRQAHSKSSGWPAEDIAHSQNNQHLLERVVNEKSPNYLFHGHHHMRYSDVLENGTSVQGLDCNRWSFTGEIEGLSSNIVFVNSDGTPSWG